jgi:hypothetical protein
MKTQNLLPFAQGGFRRYCSTNQQITMLSQENGDCFDKREKITAVSVDFKSAYDSDPRMKLVGKLQATGGETQNT